MPDSVVLDEIETLLGYSEGDALPEGMAPAGSSLPSPPTGHSYVRGQMGWILVPTSWAGSQVITFTTGRNPATGKEEPQVMPPGVMRRGAHFGQPFYPDSEVYQSTGGAIRITRAPIPRPPSGTIMDPYASEPSRVTDTPSSFTASPFVPSPSFVLSQSPSSFTATPMKDVETPRFEIMKIRTQIPQGALIAGAVGLSLGVGTSIVFAAKSKWIAAVAVFFVGTPLFGVALAAITFAVISRKR